jgi:hypothetical protein
VPQVVDAPALVLGHRRLRVDGREQREKADAESIVHPVGYAGKCVGVHELERWGPAIISVPK